MVASNVHLNTTIPAESQFSVADTPVNTRRQAAGGVAADQNTATAQLARVEQAVQLDIRVVQELMEAIEKGRLSF